MSRKLKPDERWIMGLSIAAGLALLVIGVRFLTVPQRAASFFGIGNRANAFDLHHVVALRDLWLASLLIGLAALREWRALALCLGLGAAVCVGDAAIVAVSTGRTSAIAFHAGSGIYCAIAAWLAWNRSAYAA